MSKIFQLKLLKSKTNVKKILANNPEALDLIFSHFNFKCLIFNNRKPIDLLNIYMEKWILLSTCCENWWIN